MSRFTEVMPPMPAASNRSKCALAGLALMLVGIAAAGAEPGEVWRAGAAAGAGAGASAAATTRSPVSGTQTYAGVGRAARLAEIAAWDIDVRPDFQGLPAGAGSVRKGLEVWDKRCASCHGSFGESNEVFTPIVGGITLADMMTGRVASLPANTQPQRSTLMKLSTVSTLWDYINRAMPWNDPKSLSVEEVYAVTAYVLNMGEIVSDDFVLSDKNIAQVQASLPNRNGMTLKHGLWNVRGRPDVRNVACMKDCPVDSKISSMLPAHATGASGNLADQNRSFGPVRGVATAASTPATATTNAARSNEATANAATADAAPNASAAVVATGSDGAGLVRQNACVVCHDSNKRLVGPGFAEIAAKYKGDVNAPARLAQSVRQGSSGVWGSVPMPPHPALKESELKTIVAWILAGPK